MYKYEMHIHSKPCSGGGADIEEHMEALRDKGYSGMVITNHFYNGDTRIDRALPWNEFCDAYREDYERGKAYSKKYDFDLLFGIEENVGSGKEILIYGITPDFLYNEKLKHATVSEYVELVHKLGGLVFQAHPYRNRQYITAPGPLDELALLDGIEVFNASNTPEDNEKARELAEKLSLRCTVGSDGHSAASGGRTAIVSKQRIRTEQELANILKSGDYELCV
ncbi:MAG: PHP domain-containing protein [Clostridia bacterium]|nr:PHP domain-containing protein [Clostridia bacterium]